MAIDKIKEFQKENEIAFNFYNNLKSIMQEENLSAKKFAEKYSGKSGIPESTIMSWIERFPPKIPNISNAVKLAKALGTTVDLLCEHTNVIRSVNPAKDIDMLKNGKKEKIALLLNDIIADNPNYKLDFSDGTSTLFPPQEKRLECEVIYLPLSRSNDDRPLYKGDLKLEIDTEGLCRIGLTVDTVAGKRAAYKGIVVLLNPNTASKPTYWCLMKLEEQSEHGKIELNVPAELISYSFSAPELWGWKALMVQVGNVISNSKNPAMFRALFIKKSSRIDNRALISDDDLKMYFRGLLEIYDLQQIPISREQYDKFKQYVDECAENETRAYFEKYFCEIKAIDLWRTFRKYFTQPNSNEAVEVYYLNHITPPYSDIKEGDLVRYALLMAWLRSQGKNAYLNELDEREMVLAEKIYQWLTERKK